jgi:hypothetical protein
MKYYLDDLRSLPPELAQVGYVLVRTGEELIEIIKRDGLGRIEAISFDHDLGDGCSGYEVIKVIEELVIVHGARMPMMSIHSANTVGRKNLLAAISAMSRHKRT